MVRFQSNASNVWGALIAGVEDIGENGGNSGDDIAEFEIEWSPTMSMRLSLFAMLLALLLSVSQLAFILEYSVNKKWAVIAAYNTKRYL